MLEPVRFAVVGEGPNEHGGSDKMGVALAALPKSAQGALVALVMRILAERYGRAGQPVCWVRPIRNRSGQRPKAVDLLLDEYLLSRLLDNLLRPVVLLPPSRLAVEFVVLSVDGDKKERFTRIAERSIQALPQELQERVITLVFEPMLEVLFICCKEPLEDACGRQRCSSKPPERQGDFKQCLKDWLRRYGEGHDFNTKFLQKVASHLDVGPASPLQEVPAFQKLCARLARWQVEGQQKGRP